MVKEIALTQGYVALVDDEDFEWLNQWKWHIARRGMNVYAVRHEEKPKKVYMHRQILEAPVGKEIDHINHNGLDNRRANLRVCSGAENQHNRRLKCRVSSSKYRGVSWFKRDNNWKAQITLADHNMHIGYYTTEQEAARAYNEAATRLFGEFANLNEV